MHRKLDALLSQLLGERTRVPGRMVRSTACFRRAMQLPLSFHQPRNMRMRRFDLVARLAVHPGWVFILVLKQVSFGKI